MSLLGDLLGLEVDVAEAARPSGLLICDDAGADETLVAGELLEESVVVNVPCEVADPQSGGTLALLNLGLLGGGILLLGILLSFALVGRSGRLGLLLLLLLLLVIIVGGVRRVILVVLIIVIGRL